MKPIVYSLILPLFLNTAWAMQCPEGTAMNGQTHACDPIAKPVDAADPGKETENKKPGLKIEDLKEHQDLLKNKFKEDIYKGTNQQMRNLEDALKWNMYRENLKLQGVNLEGDVNKADLRQEIVKLEKMFLGRSRVSGPHQQAWREAKEWWEKEKDVIESSVAEILKVGVDYAQSQSPESQLAQFQKRMETAQAKIGGKIPDVVLRKLGRNEGSNSDITEGAKESTIHQVFMGKDELKPIMDAVKPGHTHDEADRNPLDPPAQIGQGRDDLLTNPSRARDYFNRALDVDPKNPAALTGRAQANFKLGEYAAANQDARAALDLNPKDAAAFSVHKLSEGRGQASASPSANAAGFSQTPGGGVGSLQRGLAGGLAGSAQSSNYARQAGRALGLKDFREASAQATRAIEQNPSNAQAYNYRAMSYLGMRQYRDALQDSLAGLRLAPRSGPLLNSKSQALIRLKDYKGALTAAEEALATNPRDALAHAQKAYALGAMGDREAMLASLRMAASLDARYNASLQSALQLPEEGDVLFLFPGEEGLEGFGKLGGLFGSGRRFGLIWIGVLLGGLLLALGVMPSVVTPVNRKIKTALERWTTASPSVTPVNGQNGVLLRGQYELGRQIGMGGMGLVFEGMDRSLDRRVAIKQLRSEFSKDKRERERFIAEAKTVAALHHPNIVEIYSIVDEGADAYLVFEFIPGETLFDRLARGGPLPLVEATAVLRQVGSALDFAHGRGVIHRDLKPSNIMFDGEGRVKVTDFGIARLAKDAMSRFTLTNTVLGTPPYMSPEQEQGVVSRQSDVYSMAICYYEMLSGRLPFSGTSAGLLMNKMNMNYVPIGEVVPGLPAGLDEVFARAFTPDPEKRLASPKELVAAVESFSAVA